MLSKKDLQQIRSIISEEINNALSIEIQYEKFDKEKGMKELIKKKFHLSVWLAEQFPDLVGALRGMQEDVNKSNNKITHVTDNLKIINKILIDNQNAFNCIAKISDRVKEIPQEDIIQIESSK